MNTPKYAIGTWVRLIKRWNPSARASADFPDVPPAEIGEVFIIHKIEGSRYYLIEESENRSSQQGFPVTEDYIEAIE